MQSHSNQIGTLAGHHNQPAGPATERYTMDNKTLLRIAKALEELIALVKEDIKPRRKKPVQSWPTGLGKAENAKKKN